MKRNAIRVEAFPNARSFLKTYRPGAPGCLVLDLYMPGMSGLDLQQYLKETGIEMPVDLPVRPRRRAQGGRAR